LAKQQQTTHAELMKDLLYVD